MRLNSLLVCAMSLCTFPLIQSVSAPSSDGTCDLPPDLRYEVARKYPNTHVVALNDLNPDDKGLFQKDHNGRCPGLVKLDFYGDGKPAWALALTEEEGSKTKTELVVASQLAKGWQTKLLVRTDGPVPVVWGQAPGKYTDVYGEKTILATHPVIVFCGYNSWAVLYSWSGKDIEKIWLSD